MLIQPTWLFKHIRVLIILHFYLYATFTQHSKKIHALLLKNKTRGKNILVGCVEREMTPYSSSQMELLASTWAKSEIDPCADRRAAGSLRVGT